MDLLFVFHLIVLPVEVFCVCVVHGEAAAGFVFTLTTSDQAEGHCLWCTRWLVPGLGTRELVHWRHVVMVNITCLGLLIGSDYCLGYLIGSDYCMS